MILILLAVIAWTLISAGKCYAQTPTKKPNHVTITELEAKKALKYKADAEYCWAVSVEKDSISHHQDTIVKKQKKKLFWRGVAVAAEAAIISYLIFRPPNN